MFVGKIRNLRKELFQIDPGLGVLVVCPGVHFVALVLRSIGDFLVCDQAVWHYNYYYSKNNYPILHTNKYKRQRRYNRQPYC